jgi:alpha-L-fucosidase
MKTQIKAILCSTLILAAAAFCGGAETNAGGSGLLRLSSPLDYQVVQRTTRDEGRLTVAGAFMPETKGAALPDTLELRVQGKTDSGDLPDKWQPLPCDARVPAFRGEITLPAGGWYRVEVRALLQGAVMASAVVEHVGAGEVFVIAGQSNSANYGEERQTPESGLVAAFDGTAWRLAADPQPGAGGTKGSFVPAFGDALAGRLHVPIGIVAMGIGSTSVREWLPAGTPLTRLPTVTRNVVTVGPAQWEAAGKIFTGFTERMKLLGPQGFRAVLWHQGESDAKQSDPERGLSGGLYHQNLEQLIRDSRRAVGWEAPWFVAQVSYHNPDDVASADIREAQKSISDDGLAMPGPDTDTLTGDMREKNGAGIHLSAKGLREHGRLWAEKVAPWLEQQLAAAAVAAHAAPRAGARADTLRPATPEEMQWWRDAKFGLFIHWGPVSVKGTEISWSRVGHPFDHHGKQTVPAAEYDQLYKQFNPVKFDADAWMRMAANAGMKYVVFVAKHHDGFSMWDTKLRDYNIMHSPFGRDLCREIADAAHKNGLKLGFYYSTRDWSHPDYLKDGNAKYDEYYRGQVRELLSNYGRVDMLWFDHVAGNWRDYRFDELFRTIYGLQPAILVNNRAAKFILPTEDKPTPEISAMVRGDFDTPEQKIGKFQPNRAWESCMTLTVAPDGGWSYRPDGHMRSFDECLRMLVSCVCGDGNLLLNIGPPPTGEIDPAQVALLGQMGKWLAKYGESIYATRGGPLANGDWGGATYRANKVWLHVQKWNGDTLQLEPLSATIKSSRVLTGGEATVTQTADHIQVVLPAARQDPLDTIIELTLDRPVAETDKAGSKPAALGKQASAPAPAPARPGGAVSN